MTVWFNVTTSYKWQRSPVGIVRVEIELARELANLLPSGQIRKCVWQGDRFIEVDKSRGALSKNSKLSKEDEKDVIRAVRSIAPFAMNAEIEFALLGSQLQSKDMLVHKESKVRSNQCCSKKTDVGIFNDGDFFISVGLDWNYSYVPEFIKMKHAGVKIVSICYDTIAIKFPQYTLDWVARKMPEHFIDLAESSSFIMCISKQSEKDLHEYLYEVGAHDVQTGIIRLGDNIIQHNGEVSSAIKEIATEDFIMYVSTIERRKNHEVLYHAYHLICEKGAKKNLPKLLFVGKSEWGVDDFMRDIADDPLTQGKIVVMNDINDAELSFLYEKALFCVFPSFYEGWGLPVCEALAAGTCVISSNAGALPEAGGDMVEYLSPWNPTEWAEAILKYATDSKARQAWKKRIRTEYVPVTWETSAKQVLKIIKKIESV